MRCRVVALFVLAALTVPQAQKAACQENTSPKSEQNCQLTETDYAVYAGLLSDLGGPEDPEESWSGKEIVLVDTTAGGTEDAQRGGWDFARSRKKVHTMTRSPTSRLKKRTLRSEVRIRRSKVLPRCSLCGNRRLFPEDGE
jgi:hypothetical protein